MADFMDELQEDLRRERMEKLWKRIGGYVIAMSVVIVAVTVATVLWQKHQQNKQKAAAKQFLAADKAYKGQNWQEASTAFGGVAELEAAGFTQLAALKQASALVEAGKMEEAQTAYQSIITNGEDAGIQQLARIYLAQVKMQQQAGLAEIEAVLTPVIDANSPFSGFAQEQLAYAAAMHGNEAMAAEWLRAIQSDPDSPSSLRQRASAQLAGLGRVSPPAEKANTPETTEQ